MRKRLEDICNFVLRATAIVVVILLLLAQGASATNVTIDSDGIMNISGNRTFPVSIYYMCSQFFNTLYECSASLSINKANFTYSMGDEIYGNGAAQWPKYIPMFDTAGVGFVVRSQSLPITNTSINASPNIWHTQISANGTYDGRGSDEPPYDNVTARNSVYADANRSVQYYPTKPRFLNNFDFMNEWLSSGYIDIYGFDTYANSDYFLANYYSRNDIVYGHERWSAQSFSSGLFWNNSVFQNRSVIRVIMAISNNSAGYSKLTQSEARAITWDSIASGYQGISYYGWEPYMADPSPGLWYNVTIANWFRNLSNEIRNMNSIMILPITSLYWENDRNESYVNITPNPSKTVYGGWPQQKQFVYLLKQPNASVSYFIVVNKDINSSGDVQIKIGGLTGTQNVTFLGNATSGSGEATSNNASQIITSTNGVFNDSFDGYAVHIYQISNATSSGSSNAWTISGSGGDATWSSFAQDNVSEDFGDHDIKIGLFADNFDDNNLNGWTTTGGNHTVSNGVYKQQTNAVEWMTARPTTFSYSSPAVILAKVNVTDNGTYLDQGLGWNSSSGFNGAMGIFGGRRDFHSQWELLLNDKVNATSVVSRTLNVWSNLQLYKKSNSYNYTSSYNNIFMNTSNSSINSQYPYLLGSSDLSQFWDDVRIVPLDLNNNIVTKGNLTTWHNFTDGNVTYQILVNATTPANTNYTVWYRQNATGYYVSLASNQTGNQTISITSQYQNTDVRIQLFGNETATPDLISMTYYSQIGNVTGISTISVYNTGWQGLMVNDTTTMQEYGNRYDATWLSAWNATSQKFESYKMGWPQRATQSLSKGSGVLAKFAVNKTINMTMNASYNWSLGIEWNLIGIERNTTLSQINTSVNTACEVTEIDYTDPTTRASYTFTCGQAGNASVQVNAGEAVWVNSTATIDKVKVW